MQRDNTYQHLKLNVLQIGAEDRASTIKQLTDRILTADAIEFLKVLHHHFNKERISLLSKRRGPPFDFRKDTLNIRQDAAWKVAMPPKNLEKRHVEITGPVERKMMINALNSGADVFMGDFEDALSPTWLNVLEGQNACLDLVNGNLSYEGPADALGKPGKKYNLNQTVSEFFVRPRGWHLEEKNLEFVNEDGVKQRASASLTDFGLYVFHCAKRWLEKGKGPYLYIPKLESYEEAQLWNKVFEFSETFLKLPKASIRCTVLIETLPAAFQMDEILFALKDRILGLNAGRWDYIFSCIKKYAKDATKIFPDRSKVTMQVPFMKAYASLLVKTCHHRGAHAMGGMAAFVPSRKDAEVNERATAKVTEDKMREVNAGFDGTWVAHPDLVGLARNVFERELSKKFGSAGTIPANQKQDLRLDVQVDASMLQNFSIEDTSPAVTIEGFEGNIEVALEYLRYWLNGQGAVAIHNLMEDAATAEISRAQLWQWVKHEVSVYEKNTAIKCDRAFYLAARDRVLKKMGKLQGIGMATELLDQLVLSDQCPEFLTTIAYSQI